MSLTKYKNVYSLENKKWNIEIGREFIGGLHKMPNLSKGYHGIMKQWWDEYVGQKEIKVLLISEGQKVKSEFQKQYPKWEVETLDLYPEMQGGTQLNIHGDICVSGVIPEKKYDLIINQATLEHVYDPFGAMLNMFKGLKEEGIIITHTHPPGFAYHRYPSDYIRYMKDWWYEMEENIKKRTEGECKVKLVEFYESSRPYHVFSMYRKE